MYKSLLIIIAAMIAISTTTTVYAQQQQQSNPNINQTFFDDQNQLMNAGLPGCTMAQLIPLNITATEGCQIKIQEYDQKVCQNPEEAPHIDVCRLGLVHNFILNYVHPSSYDNLGQ